jgi:four helix bundle protein
MLEKWNFGKMDERRNINRGFKKLNVWKDSVELYKLSCEILILKSTFELAKVISNSIDAAHSISRNIVEGYCRKSIKEYLQFLNIALGSCGEFHNCYYSLHYAGQISNEEFEMFDVLHFKVENELIGLIKSLQRKMKDNDWVDKF